MLTAISLTSWAQAWVLAGSLYYGLGVNVPAGKYSIRSQIIPREVSGIQGNRSSLQILGPSGRIQWGQTDLGPGQSIQLRWHSMDWLLFRSSDFSWFQWLGQGPLGLRCINMGPQGIQAEGLQNRWSYAFSSQGLKQVAWKGDLMQWRLRSSPNHWESFTRISRASLRLQGKTQWESSQLRFDYQGKSLEFNETHSHQGLRIQMMARVPLNQHQFFYAWGGGSIPWRMSWEYRPNPLFQSHISWSDSPYLRRIGVQLRWPKSQWSIGWDQTHAGWSLRLQHPRITLHARPDMWTARITYSSKWFWKERNTPDFMEIPKAAQLHIASFGDIDHEPFPLALMDNEGREHVIHLVRGSDQWKWHLAPGIYHWKSGQEHVIPGWKIDLSTSAVALEPGEVSHIQVYIERKKKDVFWL